MEEFAAIINNLTDNARASLIGADMWAQSMDQPVIGVEHLLLGLVWRVDSTAGHFFGRSGSGSGQPEAKDGLG